MISPSLRQIRDTLHRWEQEADRGGHPRWAFVANIATVLFIVVALLAVYEWLQ